MPGSVEEDDKLMEYYVESVLDYTSRYNNLRNSGYAPENLIGKALRYPRYGDFTDAYVLRNYGKWWSKCESAQSEYRPQDCDRFGAEDYVVVKFEHGVIPKHVFIYEIYNPGAVVRVWGRFTGGKWTILWEGPPQICPPTSRKFDPPIRKICTVVNEIRLDFNLSHLQHHTSIDAIVLAGYAPKTQLLMQLLRKTSISFNLTVEQDDEKERILVEETYDDATGSELFSLLPHEVMVHIFQYLDLKSLCRCAQVNRKCYNTSLDTSLYQSLSLKKYWHKIDDDLLLNFFTIRCRGMRKLDLSWCGKENRITEAVFVRFLQNCGKQLTHLSLNYCDFVRNKAIDQISTCSELVDLRLRNCQENSWDFMKLKSLNKLIALDLYASRITDEALLPILYSNPSLKYLILDFCQDLVKLDGIPEAVFVCNRELVAWRSWKATWLTAYGIKLIAECSRLRELDLGWCLFLNDPVDCLEIIASKCKDLRRLIISRWRGVTDSSLRPIIDNCKHLEQLDLVGIQTITGEICERALMKLKNLQLLEISYCDGIRNEEVAMWRVNYPHVTIQRSCQYIMEAEAFF